MTGWWYTYPFEKYEFVSWDDSSHFWKVIEVYKSHVPNHQPDDINVSTALYVSLRPWNPSACPSPFSARLWNQMPRSTLLIFSVFARGSRPSLATSVLRTGCFFVAAELVVAPSSKFINHSMDIFTTTIVNQVISQLSKNIGSQTAIVYSRPCLAGVETSETSQVACKSPRSNTAALPQLFATLLLA